MSAGLHEIAVISEHVGASTGRVIIQIACSTPDCVYGKVVGSPPAAIRRLVENLIDEHRRECGPTASEAPPAANLAVPDLPPWERELLLKNAVVDAAVVWAQLPIGSPAIGKATAALIDAVEALAEVTG